eukprot:4984120-Amphidinium_carterae.1
MSPPSDLVSPSSSTLEGLLKILHIHQITIPVHYRITSPPNPALLAPDLTTEKTGTVQTKKITLQF